MAKPATRRTTAPLTKNMTDNLKPSITTKSPETWHEKKKRKQKESLKDCAEKLRAIKTEIKKSHGKHN